MLFTAPGGTVAVNSNVAITGYTTIAGDFGVTSPAGMLFTAPGGTVAVNSNIAITGNSNITLDTTRNIFQNTSNQYLHTSNIYSNYAGEQFLIADGGSFNPAYEGYVNIKSGGGYQGRVNIDAEPGFGNVGLGGQVTINAFGNDNPLLGYGGLITLNAFSGPLGDYGGLTSAIRLNSASIGLSAGGLYSPPGFAGSLNLFGQGLVSIVSALAPPLLPQTPESVYLFGTGGVTMDGGLLGIYHKGDAYFGNTLQPDNFNDALTITSNTVTGSPVVLSGVSSINALNFTTVGDISGVATINGVAYPPPSGNVSLWSQFPQLYTLSTVSTVVTTTETLRRDGFSAIAVQSAMDMNFNNINNVATIQLGGHLYSDVDTWTPLLKGSRSNAYDLSIYPDGALNINAGSNVVIDNLSTINGVAYPPTTINTNNLTTYALTIVNDGAFNIDDSPFINPFRIAPPYNSYVIPNSPSVYPTYTFPIVPTNNTTAGYYYVKAEITNSKDYFAIWAFEAPLATNVFNQSWGGKYVFFNNNGIGQNNMYMKAVINVNGVNYEGAQIQVSPGEYLTLEVVPQTTGGGVVTWDKIGFINYLKGGPITPNPW
jgi:hypothetical protein